MDRLKARKSDDIASISILIRRYLHIKNKQKENAPFKSAFSFLYVQTQHIAFSQLHYSRIALTTSTMSS